MPKGIEEPNKVQAPVPLDQRLPVVLLRGGRIPGYGLIVSDDWSNTFVDSHLELWTNTCMVRPVFRVAEG